MRSDRGESIAITTLIMPVFNKWAWRWKIKNVFTGKMPVLAKKYVGSLTSDYDHIKRTAEIEKDQTFLRVMVIAKSTVKKLSEKEMLSEEEKGFLDLLANGGCRVYLRT